MSGIDPAGFTGRVLEVLLAGEDRVLEQLREQLKVARIRDEERSGYGVWIDLWVEDTVPALDVGHRFAIDDVFGMVQDVDGEVGFQLHIVRGRIKTLEAWVSEEGWPDEPQLLETWYVGPDPDPEAAELVKISTRDVAFAVRGIDGDPGD